MTKPEAPPAPQDPQSVEAWCQDYCPDLPRRIEAIVAEWNLNDKANQHAYAKYLILSAVKQSVTPS